MRNVAIRQHKLFRTKLRRMNKLGYCSHSSLTLAVKLRKNMIQEIISASRSEFKCKKFALQNIMRY